jgi:hypothetical protein
MGGHDVAAGNLVGTPVTVKTSIPLVHITSIGRIADPALWGG